MITSDGTPANRRIFCARLESGRHWDRLYEAARYWLAEEPENAQAHRYAAQALVNLDRHAEAEKHLDALLGVQPDDVFGHRLFSMVHFEQKRYTAANRSIDRAVALAPNDYNNWYHLARMCYIQNDRVGALKWAGKARALRPQDPNILNLFAICSGNTPERAQGLREILELDPENALVHNNLGAFHLNVGDNRKAEACFRQALALDPTLAIARTNLFLLIKRRDPVYRVLCAPKDALLGLFRSLRTRRGGKAQAIWSVLVLLFLARFVLAVWVLWLALVWPLIWVYEQLTVGDLRAKAGEAGARSGGLWGYREWPLQARLGVFALVLVAFWSGLYILGRRASPRLTGDDDLWDLISAAGLLAAVGVCLRASWKRLAIRYHSWRRNRQLKHLIVEHG